MVFQYTNLDYFNILNTFYAKSLLRITKYKIFIILNIDFFKLMLIFNRFCIFSLNKLNNYSNNNNKNSYSLRVKSLKVYEIKTKIVRFNKSNIMGKRSEKCLRIIK